MRTNADLDRVRIVMTDGVVERKVCQAGEVVFREGEPGNCAYIVQSGRIDIVKKADGVTTCLGTVGEGGIFGEMALIDRSPRMATARAAALTILIIIPQRVFDEKLSRAEPFVRRLLHILAETVRAASK